MRVKAIRKIANDDVYNITVDDTHNFIDDGGIVLKNCDALRYFCVYWTSAAELQRTEKKAQWTGDMWDDYYNTDAAGKAYLLRKWGDPF